MIHPATILHPSPRAAERPPRPSSRRAMPADDLADLVARAGIVLALFAFGAPALVRALAAIGGAL